MTDDKHKTGLCKFCFYTVGPLHYFTLHHWVCVTGFCTTRIHTTNTKLHNLPTLTPTPTPHTHTTPICLKRTG